MAEVRLCTIENCGNPHLAKGWCAAHYLRHRKYGNPTGESPNKNLPLKWLMANADTQTDECLVYPFGKTGMGYGVVYPKGEQQVMAHRWMCERVYGPAPKEKPWVAHSCANGHLACVNPRHLRWASPKENGEDRLAHGNAPQGEGHHNSRLDRIQVLEIKRLKGAASSREAAKRFGVTRGAVSAIWSGRTWAWLTDPE